MLACTNTNTYTERSHIQNRRSPKAPCTYIYIVCTQALKYLFRDDSKGKYILYMNMEPLRKRTEVDLRIFI